MRSRIVAVVFAIVLSGYAVLAEQEDRTPFAAQGANALTAEESLWGGTFRDVAISVRPQKAQYTLDDSIEVGVFTRNFGKEDVTFVRERGFLRNFRLALFDADGRAVPESARAKELESELADSHAGPDETFTELIKPGATALNYYAVDLKDWFEIEKPGVYSLVVLRLNTTSRLTRRTVILISNSAKIRVVGDRDPNSPKDRSGRESIKQSPPNRPRYIKTDQMLAEASAAVFDAYPGDSESPTKSAVLTASQSAKNALLAPATDPNARVWGPELGGLAMSIRQLRPYTLDQDGLHVDITIENRGDEPVRLYEHTSPKMVLYDSFFRSVPHCQAIRSRAISFEGDPSETGPESLMPTTLEPGQTVSSTAWVDVRFEIEEPGTYYLVVMRPLKTWNHGFLTSNIATITVGKP